MYSLYLYLPKFLLRWRAGQLRRRIARLEPVVKELREALSGVEETEYTYIYREHLCRRLEDADIGRIEAVLELDAIEEILSIG